MVTADDLGLTRGVNEAVRQAHLSGIVTATSLLAVGAAFERRGPAWCGELPDLELGAHLALVGEDPPLLSAREVPSLVDARGAFPLSYRTVVRRGLAGRIDPDDVRRELGAQLERVLGAGVPVTHVDTHQHTHLWPTVGCGGGRARGSGRHPRGPAARPATRTASPDWVCAPSRVAPGQQIRRAGRSTTADYAGLDEAGGLDGDRFARTIDGSARRGAATLEINCHPGVADDPDLRRFAWGYRWAEELEMLVDPASRRAVDLRGIPARWVPGTGR